MANHSVAIAKASFAASLIKPDPAAVSRNEITQFHADLEGLLHQCSNATIQRCREWLQKNVTSSEGRTTAFGRYLQSYMESMGRMADAENTLTARKPSPPAGTKQLHMLYLLSDLVHNIRHHSRIQADGRDIVELLEQPISGLIGLAAKHEETKSSLHHERLSELIEIWTTRSDFSSQCCQRFKDAASAASSATSAKIEGDSNPASSVLDKTKEAGDDAPFVMPSAHGDESTPFYDLPAGNMMPHIIPNSASPINPQSMKPLRFVPGPAEQSLAAAVQELLRDAEELYSPQSSKHQDTDHIQDALGQVILRDEVTGDILDGESYYGWSLEFCRNMKKQVNGSGSTQRRGRESPSIGGSQSPRKRRRYSDTSSSRSRSRGYSRSRSRSISRNDDGRDRNHELPKPHPPPQQPAISYLNQSTNPPPPHQGPPNPIASSPAPMPPAPFQQAFPFAQGFPPVPPRPPGFVGLWPPPPPPPGPGGALPFPVPGMGFPNGPGAPNHFPQAHPREPPQAFRAPHNTFGRNYRG